MSVHRSLASGAALLTLLLTGCGSTGGATTSAPESVGGTAAPAAGDTAGSSSTATGESSATGAPTPTAGDGASGGSNATSGSGSGTGTSSGGGTASGSSRCRTGDLKVTIGPNDPGAGQENFAVVLTNTSGRTCTVYGYPGVQFQNAAHQAVTPDPTRESGTQKTRVSLAPGRSAWAHLGFSNPGVSGATTVTPARIVVTPPDEKQSLAASWTGGQVPKGGNASTILIGVLSAGTGPGA